MMVKLDVYIYLLFYVKYFPGIKFGQWIWWCESQIGNQWLVRLKSASTVKCVSERYHSDNETHTACMRSQITWVKQNATTTTWAIDIVPSYQKPVFVCTSIKFCFVVDVWVTASECEDCNAWYKHIVIRRQRKWASPSKLCVDKMTRSVEKLTCSSQRE